MWHLEFIFWADFRKTMMIFFKYLKGIPFVWGLLLKSSISVERPYSDCFVYSYYSFFHHILSSRFLRDDWMDFLEIFRVYLLDYDLNTFFSSLFRFSLPFAKFGRFPFLSVNVPENG